MTKRIFLLLLITLFSASVSAEYVIYPTNKDGSTITGLLTADFNPVRRRNTDSVQPVFPRHDRLHAEPAGR